MLLLCLQDSERCERKSSTGSLFNFSDSRHSSPRRGSFQALGDTVVRRIHHMYVVCYVTFLNSLELTYNLVNLFFTDAALLWEVVRYPECDLCDGADRQSIIDTVIVSCLCASKKTPNICHTVNNDALFSFFLRVFYILFKKFILFCTVKYLWQKSFLFSLILIRDKKKSDFYRKVQGEFKLYDAEGCQDDWSEALDLQSLQCCVQTIFLKPWQRENTHRFVDLVTGLRHTGSRKWTLFVADLGWHFFCLLALVFSYISRYEYLLWRDFGFMGGSFSCFR